MNFTIFSDLEVSTVLYCQYFLCLLLFRCGEPIHFLSGQPTPNDDGCIHHKILRAERLHHIESLFNLLYITQITPNM